MESLHLSLSFGQLLLMVVYDGLTLVNLILKGELLVDIQGLGVRSAPELVRELAPDALLL